MVFKITITKEVLVIINKKYHYTFNHFTPNFKIPLQPHQKYYITQYEELTKDAHKKTHTKLACLYNPRAVYDQNY